MDVMMPLLFYDGKEDGRGWMENLLAAVRDQIPALREGSTAENTLSAGTEAAETDTAKQDSNPGPGAERGQTESKEQGTEEDQKDGTQKDETQKDGMEITEPEQTETGITEPAAGESASTAEPEAPQSVPEETIETGGAPREILYPEADTIQETISPDLLADPQALLNRFFVVDPNTSVLPGEIDGSTYCFTVEVQFTPESETALHYAMAGNTGDCDDPDAPEGAYEYSRCCIITLKEDGWHGEVRGTGW